MAELDEADLAAVVEKMTRVVESTVRWSIEDYRPAITSAVQAEKLVLSAVAPLVAAAAGLRTLTREQSRTFGEDKIGGSPSPPRASSCFACATPPCWPCRGGAPTPSPTHWAPPSASVRPPPPDAPGTRGRPLGPGIQPRRVAVRERTANCGQPRAGTNWPTGTDSGFCFSALRAGLRSDFVVSTPPVPALCLLVVVPAFGPSGLAPCRAGLPRVPGSPLCSWSVSAGVFTTPVPRLVIFALSVSVSVSLPWCLLLVCLCGRLVLHQPGPSVPLRRAWPHGLLGQVPPSAKPPQSDVETVVVRRFRETLAGARVSRVDLAKTVLVYHGSYLNRILNGQKRPGSPRWSTSPQRWASTSPSSSSGRDARSLTPPEGRWPCEPGHSGRSPIRSHTSLTMRRSWGRSVFTPAGHVHPGSEPDTRAGPRSARPAQ
ncbi:hypothetical protein FB476_0379 [Ornithinimicrobium humiphilum]|uniref:Uncharacterized protein n=1 Tax=Ornithinimicrobium humiphilum TaxID=125288 RepID=A0A543KKD8_9MICO|nr:hypothetical protein FB476_0379 [Ornithinimicrobium humiphilum]